MYKIITILLSISSLAFAETTTEAFMKLSRYDQIKLLEDIITQYKKENVEVKFTSAEYLLMVDNLVVKNPDYAKIPLEQIFKMILEEEATVPKEMFR